MEIEFLGTGAGSPGKFRNVTSTALRLLDERNSVWLFDVGEATQHQILRTTLKPRKIDKIFITHLHGDHIFGLPGLLSSRSFQGGEAPLTIYGPKGIRDFVEVSLRVSQTKLSYKIHYQEIATDGLVFEDDKFKVYAHHLDHRITCYGYRVVEKAHPGELMVEKLRAAQVPSGPVYGQLKAGQTVTLPDGRTLNGQDFLGPSQPGRIVAILGDTRQTPGEEKLAANADVLVHESTFAKGEGKLARAYYHSTNIQAAELAKRAHVKLLLLNHISARYTGKLANELQHQAREVFHNTRVVKDFDEVTVAFQKTTEASRS
ncbi:beta-lactamase superfamily hydrolase [Levilactobacillus namurensis DSM 19117]|uniref:Ribonuclease Z n=2 Tax=Levilactobacillus namurensis TaxID=380393 RepID=A0A0R1K9I8_9LACO|nr:ribonuclease Z [Levilactobacillus namurensis]KRK77433.1 beta-lactamase superfamily hydrolase [Levilactobacillus namurensis DSM 19117]MCW3778088.1 ribonuclease Z [Levilactobacillus namurensis]MDT7014708.1 ribonuclease Z [Levilactobacillus namurensis]MDT7018435.1 ribonuclease Z [Levilactobacillus namurensis]WNN64579.1 ribonuclease Z [Levilactobacillus namurensis]